MLWGTFVALNQTSIKRLYAYSAIVNVGYILTALAGGTYDNMSAAVNYLITYLTLTLAVFIVILLFRKVIDARKIKFISEYKVFLTYSTTFSLFFSFIFFSFAGIPPLAGFFIKFFLFKSIFNINFLTNPLFFIILITSVVSAFYYIRVIRFIFFDTKRYPVFFLPLNIVYCFIFTHLVLFLLLFVFVKPFIYTFIFSNMYVYFL